MKNRLKELRQLHQWSQADFARKLEVSRQAVNGFESGKFDPTFENSKKIKLNSEIKFVLELALQVVRLRGEKSIGTEHLLWGLVRLAETGNTATRNLFQQYEVDLESLNQQIAEKV